MENLFVQPTAGRVHVLRHHFEPSAQLSQAISESIGSSVRPGFLLRSTKEVYVDSVAYVKGEYREQDAEARDALRTLGRAAFVIANAALKPLYGGHDKVQQGYLHPTAYRLALLPEDEERFSQLVTSLDAYPHVTSAPKVQRHYLYMNIGGGAFLGETEVRNAQEHIRTALAKGHEGRLLSAAVAGIRAIESPAHQQAARPDASLNA